MVNDRGEQNRFCFNVILQMGDVEQQNYVYIWI